MNRVLIGIWVHSEAMQFRRTLQSVESHSGGAQVLVLADGADDGVLADVSMRAGLLVSGTRTPSGAAACFNRLVTYRPALYYVFLESGSVVTAGWLDRLTEVLVGANGLSGPSTNLSWNEQRAFPRTLPTRIEECGRAASLRFGAECRSLAPLHSLADFCYVVRREVIEAVGAADESYGAGPCWEMDYNIRAARAGFCGVWVCGVYVHRLGFTARRRRDEASHFDEAKQRYQDRFCALKLRGERSGYEPHCRGDECEHFAPPHLITIRQPFPSPAKAPDEPVCSPAVIVRHSPRVSCIMPTCDRPDFVRAAVRYFARQDFGDSELLVVDDGNESAEDLLTGDPRIRYIRLNRRLTVGAKRNLACEEARGGIILHWDDDDWYSPSRVGRQYAALSQNRFDVSGSSRVYYYEPAANRAWQYGFTGARPWVAGNTLAYTRSLWTENPFPDLQIGEDAQFLWSRTDKRIHDLADPAICIGMIHQRNVSPKHIGAPYWRAVPVATVRTILGSDTQWYHPMQADICQPLISCIMPTRDRRAFVRLALAGFAAQTYPNRELIVVDDGHDRVADLCEGLEGVTYIRVESDTSIGRKRNLAVERARGDLIAHWDDDDWYSPQRLATQAAPILIRKADLTGLENAYVLDTCAATFWTTSPALHQRMFVGDVHGGTLVYKREVLDRGLAYPNVNLAEDATLIQRALQRGHKLLQVRNSGNFVYVRHTRNAWRFEIGRFLDAAGWMPAQQPPGFSLATLEAYCAAAAASA